MLLNKHIGWLFQCFCVENTRVPKPIVPQAGDWLYVIVIHVHLRSSPYHTIPFSHCLQGYSWMMWLTDKYVLTIQKLHKSKWILLCGILDDKNK